VEGKAMDLRASVVCASPSVQFRLFLTIPMLLCLAPLVPHLLTGRW
jgi:hypothetical protein